MGAIVLMETTRRVQHMCMVAVADYAYRPFDFRIVDCLIQSRGVAYQALSPGVMQLCLLSL